MFAPTYFAPTYFAPRYFPPGLERDVGGPTGDADGFQRGYLQLAYQEDEELLLIARAFIEIISCR